MITPVISRSRDSANSATHTDFRSFATKRVAIVSLFAMAIMACGREKRNDTVHPHSGTPANSASAAVSMSAGTDTTVFPAGPEGTAARRGFAILASTRDSMPGYVGNKLRCFSCHLDNGQRANGIPLTGVYARYPVYNARDGRMSTIQDRINNCFRRSMAGRNIPSDGEAMHDIVTYLALVSRGVAVGARVPGEGLHAMPPLTGDTSRGAAIFVASCARCHGDHGQGMPPATPLWGPDSYAIGAGMARVGRAAAFIRYNMPFDSAGVLSDQQAYDVASYIVAQPRRDSRGKENDWPDGGAPRDAPYDTKGHAAFNPPRHLLRSAY